MMRWFPARAALVKGRFSVDSRLSYGAGINTVLSLSPSGSWLSPDV